MFVFLLTFYFLLLPFQWALSPFGGVDLALIRVVTIGLILLFGIRSLLRKRLVLPDLLPSFFLGSFLFLATLSFLWAENTSFSFRKIVFLWSFIPFYFVLSSFFREVNDGREETKKKVISLFVLGATGAACIGVLQFFIQFILGIEKTFSLWTQTILPFFLGSSFGQSVATYPSLLVNISGMTLMRASGIFPDPHMFAFYLGISAPLALFLFLSTDRHRRWWLTSLLTIILADLLSFSRGGYLGLITGLGIFFTSYFLRFIVTWNMRHTLLLVGTLLTICVFFLSPFGTRFFSSFSSHDGSNTERLRLWEESASLIAARPLFGTGLGNYPLAVKPSASYREPIYAHNLYLDIALETGIVGLFFFGGFLFLGLARTWRYWKKEGSLLSLALFSSLIVFSVHSLVETPLFSVHVLPALLLIMALGV